MTHTHCDFCGEEIPATKTIGIAIAQKADTSDAPATLKKDACPDCGDRIRRILRLVDAKGLAKILDTVTVRA